MKTKTFNISLPEELVKQIDAKAEAEGFATRSEFIRGLLREKLVKDSEKLSFEEFIPQPLEKIRSTLEKTGKYNKKFIDSVMNGLSESSMYANKTVKH